MHRWILRSAAVASTIVWLAVATRVRAQQPSAATSQPAAATATQPAASSSGPAPQASNTTPRPAIEPRVGEVLDRACTLLSEAKAVTYHAEITFDSVLPSLVKLQYAAAMDVAIERPNRLAIKFDGDLGAKRLWYDGKTLTLYDLPHKAYGTIAAPDTIDAMLNEVAAQKNLTIPLAGFDYSNPCKRVRGQVIDSKYVGLNDAAGVDCDHLAFIQPEADWQLWVQHSGKPLPRKIVITYKNLPTQPQWVAVLSDWRFDQPLGASMFEPKIPKGTLKVDFLELKKDTQQQLKKD